MAKSFSFFYKFEKVSEKPAANLIRLLQNLGALHLRDIQTKSFLCTISYNP